jgi:pre-mRNA-splicing factor SYF2
MPPRRKAAGAAASAKKGKKDVKKEEEQSVANTVDATSMKEEQPESQTSTSTEQPAAETTTATRSTRSSGRTTRGQKKAVEEEVLETAIANVAADAEAEQKPDVKAEAKQEAQVVAAAKAAEGDDAKLAANATADPVNEVPPPSVAAELEGRVALESHTATSAARGGAPDIIGVVEEREDEDIIMDDSEPAPMDREEARRILERPSDVVDTRPQPPAPQRNSRKLAQKMMDEAAAATQENLAEGSTSRNESEELSDAGLSRQSRMEKMNALRKRMNESATANRKDVVAAQNEHRKALSESKRLERKRKQAEAMGEKLEAAETGEDLERKRNWEYSLADNEAWNKKQGRKERRMDVGFSTFDESARRKYRRDIDSFKPDLKAYQAQKAAALGLSAEDADNTELIAHASTSSGSQMIPGSDSLYRDANSFVYADHKPSDDAIDKVVGKLNLDLDKRAKRSRARVEDETDITYINDRNKVFNKKLERYFNKVSCGLSSCQVLLTGFSSAQSSTPKRSSQISREVQRCSSIVSIGLSPPVLYRVFSCIIISHPLCPFLLDLAVTTVEIKPLVHTSVLSYISARREQFCHVVSVICSGLLLNLEHTDPFHCIVSFLCLLIIHFLIGLSVPFVCSSTRIPVLVHPFASETSGIPCNRIKLRRTLGPRTAN